MSVNSLCITVILGKNREMSKVKTCFYMKTLQIQPSTLSLFVLEKTIIFCIIRHEGWSYRVFMWKHVFTFDITLFLPNMTVMHRLFTYIVTLSYIYFYVFIIFLFPYFTCLRLFIFLQEYVKVKMCLLYMAKPQPSTLEDFYHSDRENPENINSKNPE